jgi:hypothetical protein
MQKGAKTYNNPQGISAIFMIAMLLWLTISAPFIYACQQAQNQTVHAETLPDNSEEEAPTPITNTTEEKKPGSGTSFAEEFLCGQSENDYATFLKKRYQNSEKPTSYIAFHGELISPPPDNCQMKVV